jgi:hypothetical protein
MSSTNLPATVGSGVVSEEEAATPLKADRLGRIRFDARQREKLLEAFERSGMSGAAFARHCGVKYPTFIAWVRKRKRAAREGERPEPAGPAEIVGSLAEVVVGEGGCGAGKLLVRLPGGASLELARTDQARLAAALITQLERHLRPC